MLQVKQKVARADQPCSVDLRPSFFDAGQNIRDHFRLRFRALRTAVVKTDAHRDGFHVATSDDEHGVDFGFLGFGNLGFDRAVAQIGFDADQ